MNLRNKRIISLGLILPIFSSILSSLRTHYGIMMYNPWRALASVFSMVALLGSFLVALGFGLEWLESRDVLDFFSTGIFGLNFLYSLMMSFFPTVYIRFIQDGNPAKSAIFQKIISIVLLLYLLIFALRALRFSVPLSLMFGVAFIYNLLIRSRLLYRAGVIGIIAAIVIDIGIRGMCILEISNE